MELQWVMVVELEKVVPPLEEQLQKEKSRIPRNQQNITRAEVRSLQKGRACIHVYMYIAHTSPDKNGGVE